MGAPQSIGPYKIVQPLGKGGMGVVYKAVHGKTGQSAALKTVNVPHQAEVASIRREIHALARIRHPGVVRILDEGLHEGVPWYAMELLEGTTLKQYAAVLARIAARAAAGEGGRITPTPPEGIEPPEVIPSPPDVHDITMVGTRRPLADATKPAAGGALAPILSTLAKLCEPLAFLHGEGIVHRDLKPDNVLVLPGANPVLVDFGVVSVFGGQSSRESLELRGHVVGTVHYMSPEQGRGELVDARADLYSLGCILYELVTGKRPFEGGPPLKILVAHITETPVPPSRLVTGVPPELEALIMRLLAKQPKSRVGHAHDVAEALRTLVAETEPSTPVEPRPRDYLYRPGLAGRQEALDALMPHLDRLRTGGGGLLLIGGESGVGKTRLATELLGEARKRRFSLLTGECLQRLQAERSTERGGGAPLEAFRKPLQSIADRCREGGRDVTDRLLGKRGKLLSLYEPSLAALPGQDAYLEPAELPPDAARQRLFLAMVETLYAFSDGRPAVIVLDDLHWADDLTSGLLAFIVRGKHLAKMPVCLVGTYRTDEVGDALAGILDGPNVTDVRLGRLAESAIGEMVADMLALAPPPEDFVAFLSRYSEGNPFFVAEYLRTAVAEGILHRERSGWKLAESRDGFASGVSYESLPLPGSLRDLVARRLGGLSTGARHVAEVASLLGRSVDGALLAGVARLPEKELMEAVEELIARQVMEDLPRGRCQFTHDKLREVAYERLDESSRRELHHRAAEALSVPPIPDEQLAELGHHWEQAGDEGQARTYYLKAARRAAATFANKEAERLFKAYLALCKRPNPESVMARNELARDVLAVTGRSREAIEEHEQAYEDAGILHDLRGQAQALQGLSSVHRLIGHPTEAQAYAERSLAIFAEMGDRGQQGLSLTVLAASHLAQGHLDQAQMFFERALQIHRELGNRKLEAITLSNIAVIERDRGRLEEAQALQQLALANHREVVNRRSEGITLDNLGTIYTDRGDLDIARRHFEESIAILRDVGDRRYGAVSLSHMAQVIYLQGKTTQSLALYEEAVAMLRDVGDRPAEAEARCEMAIVERKAGVDLVRVEAAVADSEDVLRRQGNALSLARCLCERGHLALAMGQSGRSCYEEGSALARSCGVPDASPLGSALTRLRRALESFEAGQPLETGDAS